MSLALARLRCPVGALALVCSSAPGAAAFTVDDVYFRPRDGSPIDVDATLAAAGRWSTFPDTIGLGSTLSDGLSVAVAPGFAENLGAAPGEVAAYEQAVVDSFAAWSSPVLDFDLTFDGPVGTTGLEIDLFAVPDSNPVFQDNDFGGFTSFVALPQPLVGLTNGQVIQDGTAILQADIYINTDTYSRDTGLERVGDLQRLLLHEIGHALGLDHPSEFSFANFDQDGDPLNAMGIDPADPTAGLMVSPAFDPDAIMVTPFSFASRRATALAFDDVAGRDVLYPIPEPATALLLAAGLAGVATLRRRASLR